MADRIREAYACRAAVDRRAVQRLERFGLRAGRVFGHVHDREAVLHGIRHGFFGRAEDLVQRPILGVLPYWRGADEGGGLDGDPDLFGNPDDRLDVRDHRASRAVGEDSQLLIPDLAGQLATRRAPWASGSSRKSARAPPWRKSRPLAGHRQASYCESVDQSISRLLAHERIRAARHHLERTDEVTLARQAALSAIPAPTGAEGRRAA